MEELETTSKEESVNSADPSIVYARVCHCGTRRKTPSLQE